MPSFSTTVVFLLFWVMSTTTTIGGNTDGRKIKHSKKTNGSGSAVGGLSTVGVTGYNPNSYVQVRNQTPYPLGPATDGWWESWNNNAVVWYSDPKANTRLTPRRPYQGISEGIAPGDTWMASERRNHVYRVTASLILPHNRKLTCTPFYTNRGTKASMFSIIMDDVNRCSVRSNQDWKTPITECAARYCIDKASLLCTDPNPFNIKMSCCGQEEPEPVSPHFVCPQSKPTCVNYVANEKLGTCVPLPNVQVKNDTPYAVAHSRVWYTTPFFEDVSSSDYTNEGIAPGDTWTATSRRIGFSKVWSIEAYLAPFNGSGLRCTQYLPDHDRVGYWNPDSGTTNYLFSIIMDGVDRCFVRTRYNDDTLQPWRCTAHYGSNDRWSCPQFKPNCVKDVANDKMGTCE